MSSKGSVDSDSSVSDSSSDSVASDALVKNIPKRATRGVRKRALAGEAAQADEEFWGQRAFGEPESDSEFSSVAATTDSSDSDIDEPEPDEKADARAEREAAAAARMAEAMMGPAKRNVYVDPALRRKKAAAARRAAAAGGGTPGKPAAPRGAAGTPGPSPTLAGTRSKRNSTIEATAEAEARSAAPASSVGGDTSERGGESVAPPPRATQAELLRESATTTLQNLLALATGRTGDASSALAGSKADRKQKAGHRVVFRSARGHGDILSFKGVDDFPAVINAKAPPEPPKPLCCVSGAAAKHRCPLSWLPYSGPREFRRLRRRLARGQLAPRAASPLGRGALRCPSPPRAHSSDSESDDGSVVWQADGAEASDATATLPSTSAAQTAASGKPGAAMVMAAARAAIAAAKAAAAASEDGAADADVTKKSRGGSKKGNGATSRGRKRQRGS